MKYKKKPVVVEAYQTDKEMIINTLEGVMKASVGDYIITGVNGEQYPCKPDIFEKTYEILSENEQQDPFINIPCVSQQACHEDKIKVLDKISNEIKRKASSGQWSDATIYGMKKCLTIIEKYRGKEVADGNCD